MVTVHRQPSVVAAHWTSIPFTVVALARRAPVGRARHVITLAGHGDRPPTAAARSASAAVGVQRPGRPPITRGGDPFGPAPRVDVGTHQAPGGRDQALQRRIVERSDGHERGDALDPEDLVLVDVADPGQRPLVQQRHRDLEVGALRCPESLVRLGGVEIGRDQIGTQPRERRVEALAARLEELHDRRIEADGDRAVDLQHQPGPTWRPAPPLPRPIAMPRAVHPQVGAELQTTVEADQQVLALGLHGIDAPADDPVDLWDSTRTLGASGPHVPPDEVWPQPGGGPEERVAFGHGGSARRYRSPRRTRPR